jgi:SAM-dependent methyltransferase
VSHDAERWNLSPERLYLDCWTRWFLREHLRPSGLEQACNVGIGLGEFDDWLGYWLEGHGQLVSIDIDGNLVQRFVERQAREKHPNPSRAVHADLLRADLGTFDLVTMVGSTVHETHAPARALRCAQRWVKPGGWLFATVLHGMGDPARLLHDLQGVVHLERFTQLPEVEFTAVLARR